MSTLNVRPLRDDFADLEAALASAGLPVSDLHEPDRLFFRFEDDGGVVGFAGLEGHGDDRLLRSVVIVAQRRGSGLGSGVISALEAAAVEHEVATLHLLTTDAGSFFARRGYETRERDAAPEAIKNSREFTALCPASATYMSKVIAR